MEVIFVTIKDSNSRIILTIPSNLKDKIKEAAVSENRSISNYIVNILKNTVGYDDKNKTT
jgi:hypothetical protein